MAATVNPSNAASHDFKYYATIDAVKNMTTERPGYAVTGSKKDEKLPREITVRGAGNLVLTDSFGNDDITIAILDTEIPWVECIAPAVIKATSTCTKVLVKW